MSRVAPDITEYMQPLEDAIVTSLLPDLTGRLPPGDPERQLLALPVRLGGLGIGIPTSQSSAEFQASTRVVKALVHAITNNHRNYSYEIVADQLHAKSEIRTTRRSEAKGKATELKSSLPDDLQRAMELAQEKGSSTWLTALPIKEHGFFFHKGGFLDAIAMRYGWTPRRLSSNCACGSTQSVEHALSCPKGGFPSIRHNEIRDLTANLLTEVCSDVCIEPELQPLSGEVLSGRTANREDGARLDIAANGLWGGRYERTFVDVRIFNPHAPTNANQAISTCYKTHERIKKRAYEQRVRDIEHASFTPLVMSATGGMANEATQFYKRLASRLAEKWDQPYSSTMAWLRCRLTFSLLRSAIQSIRGARSRIGHACRTSSPMDLVTAESHLSLA